MSTINTITKTLSIAPDGIPTVMRLSQNENGRQLVFELSDAVPGGSSVLLAGTKPDGHAYSLSGTISGNKATFKENTQMTCVPGTWAAKVIIMNGADTVATGTVCFMIDADPVDPFAIQSESDIQSLVAQAQAYADAASAYAVGAPIVALNTSAMTDHSKVYLYEGNQAGYTAGHFYYWSGSAWVSGGQYGAGTIAVDAAMSNSSTNPVQNNVVNAAIRNAISTIPVTNNDDGGWGLAVYNHPYSTREWVGMEWEHWDTQNMDIDYCPTLVDSNGDPDYNGKIKPKYVGYASSSDYGLVKFTSSLDQHGIVNYRGRGAFTRNENGTEVTIYVPQLLDYDTGLPSSTGHVPSAQLPPGGSYDYTDDSANRGIVGVATDWTNAADAPNSVALGAGLARDTLDKIVNCLDHITGVDASFAAALTQLKNLINA